LENLGLFQRIKLPWALSCNLLQVTCVHNINDTGKVIKVVEGLTATSRQMRQALDILKIGLQANDNCDLQNFIRLKWSVDKVIENSFKQETIESFLKITVYLYHAIYLIFK